MPDVYTVKTGDNLWIIAKEKLGDGNRWKEIYRLNQAAIDHYSAPLYPGQTLVLPKQSKPHLRQFVPFLQSLFRR